MSKPYTDDDVARLRSFKALRGGEQPDPNEVAYLSRPLRWLATLDASRAAYAALVTERDEAVQMLRECNDLMRGHMIGVNCKGPCLTQEQVARLARLIAPAAAPGGG